MTKVIVFDDPEEPSKIVEYKTDPKGKPQKFISKEEVKSRGLKKAAEEHIPGDKP